MAATLKDVAEKAGVSIRTAGRALRGVGPVRGEVAERVLAAARSLHYVPNAAARSLKQRSSRIVGVVTGSIGGTEAGQRRMRMLEEAFRIRRLHTLVGALPGFFGELENLLREWNGLVSHVIFLSWPAPWDAAKLRGYPLRFLFLDCGPRLEGFDNLLVDRPSGIRSAVHELILAGARRIAHVSSPVAVGRHSGFHAAVEANPAVETFTIETEGLDFRHGYQAGPKLRQLRIDAAFFDTDRMALGFYRYAHEHGISIPDDIAVAGFDDDSACAYAIPTLTSVAHPDREAVDRIAAIVTGPAEAPAKTEILPTRLVSRESSANRKTYPKSPNKGDV